MFHEQKMCTRIAIPDKVGRYDCTVTRILVERDVRWGGEGRRETEEGGMGIEDKGN